MAELLAAVPERVASLRVRGLADYFGLWAVESQFFAGAVERFKDIDLAAHIGRRQKLRAAGGSRSGTDDVSYPVTAGGIAVVALSGTLMKRASSFGESSSTVLARRQIKLAAADPEVQAIAVKLDTPGGIVAGTADLCDAIRGSTDQKPCWAYVEDQCCSAGYWAACGAGAIYANSTAMVGSIGVYSMLVDSSSSAAAAGIKVHVVRSGKFKGAGASGTEITPEQLAEAQRVVDQVNAQFVAAVARARKAKLTAAQASELADGRVHIGASAADLGLIDGVLGFDDFLAALAHQADKSRHDQSKPVPSPRSPRMSAATYQEIVAACVGADPPFICAQLAKGATLDESRASWMAEQNARLSAAQAAADKLKADKDAELAAAKAESDRAKAEADKLRGRRPGAEPLPTSGAGDAREAGGGGDPIAEYDRLFDERLKTNGNRRSEAASFIARQHPAVQRAFVLAYNASHGRDPERLSQFPKNWSGLDSGAA